MTAQAKATAKLTWAKLILQTAADSFGGTTFTRKALIDAIGPAATQHFPHNANITSTVAQCLRKLLASGHLVREARGLYKLSA